VSDLLLVVGCDGADQASALVTAVLAVLGGGGFLTVDASRFSGAAERLKLCRMPAHRGLRYREGAHIETEIVARKPEPLEGFAVAS